MSATHQSGSAAASSNPASGLDDHLRNLILSHGSSGPGSLSNGPTNNGQPAQPGQSPSSNGFVGESPTQIPSQPSKPGRKRPNQAQRRQMNSQLAIPIDPRPQQSTPPRPYQTSTSHHPRPSHSYQRHTYANSDPRGPPHEGRTNPSYAQGPWSGPPQHRASHSSGQPPYHPQGQYSEPRWGGPGQLYNHRRQLFSPEEVGAQAAVLDRLCFRVVSSSEIERSEIADKEAFRCRIEAISRDAIAQFEKYLNPSTDFSPLSVELKCFGSLSSGFATKASDMDLGLLSPMSTTAPDAPGSRIPRLLEKAFLDAGLGARLLTRTRVPIIKLCESPPKKLRQDLLDERDKWEKGLENETHDTHEDEEHDNIVSNDRDDDHSHVTSTGDGSPSATEFTVPGQGAGETQSFHLKQGPKSSLASYYGLAKRILRRAGGRDVTMSSFRDFTGHDWVILNRVCQAFVTGLSDPELRQRMGKCLPLPYTDLPTTRSLQGVCIVVEGEHILQLLEKRTIHESHPGAVLTEQAIKMWYEVLNNMTFGDDPIYYTKQLQLALDRLKKSPSVQFITLEQGQHEAPAQYFARAVGIFGQLQPDNNVSLSGWHESITTQYVAGIHQEEIRGAVQDFIKSSSEPYPPDGIARRHESLHLAWELERALDKDFYETPHIQDIKEYITLLRSPLQKPGTSDSNTSLIIPLTPETSALVARIRTIPDPHRMAPNQPRDRYRDRLEFPKTGTGVQCDINFSAHLALQNTLLLRCYSHTDPRVRPMVLFVKHWAKVRGINSGYRGTLSSYGYVLMVLHYLVNVAQPFVCPNLQQLAPKPPPNLSPAELEKVTTCRGFNIQFWRNEDEIIRLAHGNQLNGNIESVGHLLRGFFEYYAQIGMMSASSAKGFDWGRDVLSLRTPGGLLSKSNKGWTGAKTVLELQGAISNASSRQNVAPPSGIAPPSGTENSTQGKSAIQVRKPVELKEVRHRYLFAIEDPFEVNHNVARTVTHNGIVSIRDEFRRAWAIIRDGGSNTLQEDLLQDVNDFEEKENPFLRLLDDIHGVQSV
ncbi:hypothetical protein AK830_g6482 [Neonectria ditissima]|uniref:polynucleotide adenylyltransferase n=1 Tax=Neonectria ditissima TaxID=78410 RepID=A0A0P7B1X8_9HYPO|nr:hypothetical protein AK830_g6482 [Neonectria ditissima]